MQFRQCFECLWDMFMNAYEKMLAGNADADASYPDADHVST